MDNGARPQRKRARAVRDVYWISLAAVVLLGLAVSVEAFGRAHEWMERRVPDAVDEMLAAIVLLGLGFAVFAVRRWRELGNEVERRARAEAALEESEQRYRGLVELSPDAILVHSEGRLVFANASAGRLLGARRANELIGKSALDIVHPDYRNVVAERIRSEIKDGKSAPLLEEKFVRLDGRVIDVEVSGIPFMYRGKPAGQVVARDITERKRIEERFREAEQKYRTLVEQLPAVVYIDAVDDISTALYVSPHYEQLVGFTNQERMSDPELWVRQLHPDDRERVLTESIRTNTTGDPFIAEYRMIAKDGRVVWIRDEATLVRDEGGAARYWQGVMLDITQRKRAEDLLREAEARYRTLVETVPAVTYIDLVDDRSTTIYISPQLLAMFGYTPNEWMTDPELRVRVLHPDDREQVLAAADRHRRTGEPLDVEYRIKTRGGRWMWIKDQAHVVRDEAGIPRFSQGVMFDLTEGKQAEEQLRAAEGKYRTLVEQIPAIAYIDPLEREPVASVYISPQVESMFGFSQEEWLSGEGLWIERLHPDDRERVLAESDRSDDTGEPYRCEYRMIARDGRVVWVRDEAKLIRDEAGDPVLWQGIMYDITEQKLAEQALEESERREREAAERLRGLDDMKNTFLAAVSHELRSPLTSILGLSLTLQQQALSEEDRTDLLDRLAANARKLDRLLKDLLDIDRLNRGIFMPQYWDTDVGALTRRTVESLELLQGRSIFVEADPVIVPVDAAKVERIVENLLANAVRHTDSSAGLWVRVRAQAEGVLIAVEDDGAGVPRELWEEIFEPFRQGPTPSPHSPGTGIGLSLVARFAELHGGRAWVQEREGGGASFRVFLPGVVPSGEGGPADGEHEPRGTFARSGLDHSEAG